MIEVPRRVVCDEGAWEQELQNGIRRGLTRKEAEARNWRLLRSVAEAWGAKKERAPTGALPASPDVVVN